MYGCDLYTFVLINVIARPTKLGHLLTFPTAGMLCPEYLSLMQVRWTDASRNSFYGHRLAAPVHCTAWPAHFLRFVHFMCAITDFNLGSVSRIHSLVGPGITYRALLRVCSLYVRDHF